VLTAATSSSCLRTRVSSRPCAIVSRAVFVGLREAVRQMKTLIREAAAG